MSQYYNYVLLPEAVYLYNSNKDAKQISVFNGICGFDSVGSQK